MSRVIVNQAHCIATGGSFDNGLPFSLSMGCGTWGRNNFSDNMNYRHYLNITRVCVPIPERVPTEEEIFGAYFASRWTRTDDARRSARLVDAQAAIAPARAYVVATRHRPESRLRRAARSRAATSARC